MAYRPSYAIIVVNIISVLSLLIPYIVATKLGHIEATSYFTNAGDSPPESTLFTQLFAINATILVVIYQSRYVQIFRYLEAEKAHNIYHYANNVSVAAGYLSSLGLIVLACFQETHVYAMHMIGRILFFFGTWIFVLIQTLLPLKLVRFAYSRIMFLLRLVLSITMTFCLVAFVFGYATALKKFTRPWEERLHWKPEDGGWKYHVTSIVCEWAFMILFNLYLATLFSDLDQICFTKKKIVTIWPTENLEREREESDT